MLVKKEKCWHSGLRAVVADCDASLTAPGAQVGMVQDRDASPSKKGSVHPVVKNTAASGEPFKMRFEGCSSVPDATDELLSNMERFLVRYEVEHGFRRRASRFSAFRTRLSLFSAVVPASCTDALWFSYALFRQKIALMHLSAQPYRILESCPPSVVLCTMKVLRIRTL